MLSSFPLQQSLCYSLTFTKRKKEYLAHSDIVEGRGGEHKKLVLLASLWLKTRTIRWQQLKTWNNKIEFTFCYDIRARKAKIYSLSSLRWFDFGVFTDHICEIPYPFTYGAVTSTSAILWYFVYYSMEKKQMWKVVETRSRMSITWFFMFSLLRLSVLHVILVLV